MIVKLQQQTQIAGPITHEVLIRGGRSEVEASRAERFLIRFVPANFVVHII
ncbi:hypothetical protein VTO73DRAFT_10844 [Trametes versicolor]